MKKRLLIIGGKGSGEMTISIFEAVNQVTNEWIIEGFLTDIKEKGEFLGKHKVIGSTNEIRDYVDKGYYINYTLHCTTKNKFERIQNFKALNIPLEANASAIHPQAYISPSTIIGKGVVVSPFAASSFGPEIGNFVHFYSPGYIAHDSVIDDYCVITAHSILGSGAKVGEGAHLGLNSCVRENLAIGKYSIIGMGAVVTKDVGDFEIVAGNPAKVIGSKKSDKI